jgi:hypothetical protein
MDKTRRLLKMVLPFDYQTKTGPFYSYEWGIRGFQFVRNTNGSCIQMFCIQIPTVLDILVWYSGYCQENGHMGIRLRWPIFREIRYSKVILLFWFSLFLEKKKIFANKSIFLLFWQELYYMLTTQLEKQRLFYEEKIERMEINAQRENEEVIKRARYLNMYYCLKRTIVNIWIRD